MAIRALDNKGQATVSLVAVLPVALSIAAIAVNALLFFSECAKFDRVSLNAVRVCAASPGYEQGLEQSVAAIEAIIEREMGDHLTCEVAVEGAGTGFATFTATLFYEPTLFGLDLRNEVFGVALPQLTHEASIAIDTYKPGILI